MAAQPRSIPDLPLRAGALVGALAYLVGYTLTLGVLVIDASLEGGVNPPGDTQVGSQFVEVVGTVFYNAHFLPLEVQSARGTGPYHILDTINLALPNAAYQLVPIAVLLAAGYAVASRVVGADVPVTSATRAGASITLGYLPLVAVGTQLFVFSGVVYGSDYTVSTVLLESVIRAGLVHPLLFGAFGGLAAAWHAAR